MIIWSVLSVYFDLLTLSPRSVVGTVVFDNLPITGQNWRDCVHCSGSGSYDLDFGPDIKLKSQRLVCGT